MKFLSKIKLTSNLLENEWQIYMIANENIVEFIRIDQRKSNQPKKRKDFNQRNSS